MTHIWNRDNKDNDTAYSSFHMKFSRSFLVIFAFPPVGMEITIVIKRPRYVVGMKRENKTAWQMVQVVRGRKYSYSRQNYHHIHNVNSGFPLFS
jgi:hypothetical protein